MKMNIIPFKIKMPTKHPKLREGEAKLPDTIVEPVLIDPHIDMVNDVYTLKVIANWYLDNTSYTTETKRRKEKRTKKALHDAKVSKKEELTADYYKKRTEKKAKIIRALDNEISALAEEVNTIPTDKNSIDSITIDNSYKTKAELETAMQDISVLIKSGIEGATTDLK